MTASANVPNNSATAATVDSAHVANKDPQVLIVGGGPSGMVLALALAQNGVRSRLIEKNPDPRIGQRGAGIMPRSMELFQLLKVLEPITQKAIAAPQVRMYKLPGGVEPISTFDMVPVMQPTPAFPFLNIAMLGQDNLENILKDALRQWGCVVEIGTELISFTQDDEGVNVTLRGRNGVDEKSTYEWMVGTDGARGVVRKQLGLSFLGETRTVENLVIGDIMVEGLKPNYWHMWGDASTTLVSLRPTENPNLFAFFVGGVGVNHKELATSNDALRKCLEEGTGHGANIKFGAITWVSNYTPNIRMVEQFRVGRVLIAGDAGHVHSLTGGQGLNTGIQDSFNLGWKLALVQRKLSPSSLLDTYTEERIPVIAEMLNRTTKILNRTFQKRDEGAWKHGGSLLQLGVNYRWSGIVVDEQGRRKKKTKRRREQTEEEKEYNRVFGLDEEDFDEDELMEEVYEDDDEDDGEGGEGGDDGEAEDDAAFWYDEDEDIGSYGSKPGTLGLLRAGDRAPDAPGLMEVGNGRRERKRLFDILGAAQHVVFALSTSLTLLDGVRKAIERCPMGTVRFGVVFPAGEAAKDQDVGPADLLIEDEEGCFFNAYALQNGCQVVVVRPDGVLGAIVKGPEGVDRYFSKIFGWSM